MKTERRDSQHKESETSDKKGEDQIINVCTTICNVTEAGDVPITMGIVPIWLYHKDNPNNKICVYALLHNADRNPPVDQGPQINGRSCKAESCPTTPIMVKDLEQEEVENLKLVQANAFDNEVKTLREFQAQTEGVRKDRQCDKERKAFLKKTSSPNALDPYLDATRVLRVGDG